MAAAARRTLEGRADVNVSRKAQRRPGGVARLVTRGGDESDFRIERSRARNALRSVPSATDRTGLGIPCACVQVYASAVF